jgi:hypothetical protein
MSIKSGLKKFFNGAAVVFGVAIGSLGLFGVVEGNIKSLQSTDRQHHDAELFEQKVAENMPPSLEEAKAFQEQTGNQSEKSSGALLVIAGWLIVKASRSKKSNNNNPTP